MEMPSAIAFTGDYINGQFVKSNRPDTEWKVLSPADLKDHITTIEAKYDHVEEACVVAKKAFAQWSKLSLDDRKNYLLRLKEVYLARKSQIAEIISRETGKPFWETEGEATAMISKIDITLGMSLDLVKQIKIESASPGADGYITYRPRGVMAVLGPFNFPGHLPNGHIIPALITGNTVVFKPSEITPVTGQLMAQMFHEAGFPKGVFNLVQGPGETGRRLVKNENVDAVLFTGSYDTGLKIKQEITTHFWKTCALEMGGKNASIVWSDADMNKAIYENLIGAFSSTGQRCSCTSRIILHKNIRDQFLTKYYEAAKKIKIGYWKDKPFMGPLINASAVEKYLRFQEIAKREGAESIMRGKALELEREGYYVTPSIYAVDKVDAKSVYQKEEIFGPNVAVYTVDEFDEALKIVNNTSYGLVAAIFTKQRELYEKMLQDARVGVLHWNRATAGASSKLPFGGMDKSSNDRPSGHFAVYYCTVPVASLEDKSEFDASKVAPGIIL